MKSDLVFHSVLPFWFTIGFAFVALVLLITTEVRRKNSYLSIRIICHTAIVFSIVAMLLRPSYLTERKLNGALLLTRGYDEKIKDSLLKKLSLRLLQAPELSGKVSGATHLPSWHELKQYVPSIQYVVGEGLPLHAINEYPELAHSFFPAELPQGITAIAQEPMKAGVLQYIHGEFNSHNENLILKIVGPAGVEDSIKITKKGVIPFSLKVHPRTAGKFIYQFVTIQNGKPISVEALPIDALPQQKLKILFLQQHPVFETRYLKNFLGDNGHEVTLRYQVSKNTFKYEYFNSMSTPIGAITPSLLSTFDVVITTADALETLSRTEIQSLTHSVGTGLGVLILFNGAAGKVATDFIVGPVRKVKADTASFRLPFGSEQITLPAMGLRAMASPALNILIEDKDHMALSGYFPQKSGKVGFQFLEETYRLTLEGKANEYGRLWTPLLEHVARRQPQEFKISMQSSFPIYVDEPVGFDVIAAEKAPMVSFNGYQIPLIEDVAIDNLWTGTIWPSTVGWQELVLQDSTSKKFYVTDSTQWQSLKVAQQLRANILRASDDAAVASESFYRPVSRLFFFLLFVLASGILWLVAKI